MASNVSNVTIRRYTRNTSWISIRRNQLWGYWSWGGVWTLLMCSVHVLNNAMSMPFVNVDHRRWRSIHLVGKVLLICLFTGGGERSFWGCLQSQMEGQRCCNQDHREWIREESLYCWGIFGTEFSSVKVIQLKHCQDLISQLNLFHLTTSVVAAHSTGWCVWQ